MSMNILIIDGQGGQLGAGLIKAVLAKYPDADLTAVGTNAVATASMLKAGVQKAATGENPVVVAARKADVIMGPIGIVIADALMGEVTPQMSVAVGQSDAVRILLPMNKCDNIVAGVGTGSMAELVSDAVRKLEKIIEK